MKNMLKKVIMAVAIVGTLQGFGMQVNAKEVHPDGCPECREGCHHWRFISVERDGSGYVNIFECSKCGDMLIKK